MRNNVKPFFRSSLFDSGKPNGLLLKIFRFVSAIVTNVFYRIRDFRVHGRTVLVYSMGKVGSTSVYQSLKRRFPKLTVFHTHFLSDHWLKNTLPYLDDFFSINIDTGNKILEYIGRNPRKRLTIITLVREPMMRDISNIFENHPGLFAPGQKLDVAFLRKWIDELSHDYTINWFDSEFYGFLDFDIYSVPFDKERGFLTYSSPRADILCLKVERLDEIWATAMKEFLNVGNIPLISSNLSLDKAERALYRQLKESYRANHLKLERLYGSRYVKHFYTEGEVSRFLSYWREPLGTDHG